MSREVSTASGRQRKRVQVVTLSILTLLLALVILSIGSGATNLQPGRVIAVLWQWAADPFADTDRDRLIVIGLRLPRVLGDLLVGGLLATAGALMQGLFRNPLADPGLIGVSSGSALAAAATIVAGDALLGKAGFPFPLLPVGAFLGGLAATFLLYRIATRDRRTATDTMLLAGIALGSFAGALTGLLSYLSTDQQLRDLTFWSLGSLAGMRWDKVSYLALAAVPLALAGPLLGRGLNALAFGEAEAYYLGFDVERVKRLVIVLTSIAVGASVAVAGIIGFIGIVAPHLVRLLTGPDHRSLLPLSALTGAALLTGADTLARTVIAPAELPVGILTAALGAPFFLWLILRRQRAGARP